MKEVTEHVHQNTFEKFCDVIFPVYLEILSGQPSFIENPENQTRVFILELLPKIILSAHSFTQYEKVFQVLLDIMEKDNENNGISAARLLSDILKSTTQLQFSFDNVLKPLFAYLSKRAQMFYVLILAKLFCVYPL